MGRLKEGFEIRTCCSQLYRPFGPALLVRNYARDFQQAKAMAYEGLCSLRLDVQGSRHQRQKRIIGGEFTRN